MQIAIIFSKLDNHNGFKNILKLEWDKPLSATMQ